ncbi:MAG TPA: BatD family protein [Candidatus Competibacteraceae bacterium]|nr:BatD family protein [Candidatus Competibacteraceae bacterium]
MRIALFLLMLTLSAVGQAADAPQVRVQLEQTGPIYVGQSLRLNVTVLVPNYFLSALQFPLFDLPGAVVTMPDEGAANLNETIDGVTYAGIRRSYVIVPQRDGNFVLPPVQITFQYAAVPGQSSPGSVTLPPEKIDVLAPPGAKSGQGAVAVASMTIKQQVEGLAKTMHVGDAITRTIEIDADQTQSMMIPPPSFTAPEGVHLYKRDPQLTDLKGDRGQFEGGRRVDVVTYRFDRPGHYLLPKVSVSWFDPGTQKTQLAEAPEIQVTVVASAQQTAIAPPPPSQTLPLPENPTTDWQRWLVPTAVVLGVLVVAWRVRRWPAKARGFLMAQRAAQRETEGAYFERLFAACRANDPARSYAALAAWVQRTGATSIRDYVQATTDEELQRRVAELERYLYSSCAPLSATWTGAPLATALQRTRQSFARQHVRHLTRHHLSALNPPRVG